MHTPKILSPEKITELFQSACQFHQDGRLEEAKVIYLDLLDYIDSPLLHYNLGLVHFDLQQIDIALMWFESAVAGNPQDCDSLFNLALCQKYCDKPVEAIETYHKVLVIDSKNIDTMYNIASCYRDIRMDDEAINTYHNVLEQCPHHQAATNNLAYMYQLTGNTTSAIYYYKRLLDLDPDRDAARHMLASLEGITPDSPPESYVRDVFDNYSERYEESLVKHLEYSVPVKLRKHLDSLSDTPDHFCHGIDLGCGTGLSGEAFCDRIDTFEGVDLSPKMIEQAKQKKIYHNLHTGNITDTLQGAEILYDFVLAADVFIYLGNLQEIFELVAKRTRPESIFCFSTEPDSGNTFTLQLSGRFAHSPEYINKLAMDSGWQVMIQKSTSLRKERGAWLKGNLWILRRIA